MLRRSAAVAAGVWSIPVVESFTRPAAAGSEPPTGSTQCLKQVFITDSQGTPLTFTPGRDRSFDVDLHASFAEITSITVRMYESPADPVGAGENGHVVWKKEDGSPSAIGVGFFGNDESNLITIGFSPGGGHPPNQTYADLLADGKAGLTVAHSAGAGGSFTLLRVEVEVCGTLA